MTRDLLTSSCKVDITMPLLYAEGSKAFSRLHAEILRTIDDETIFLGGLTSTDQDLSNWSNPNMGQMTMEHDFLATPNNILSEFHPIVRPFQKSLKSAHTANQFVELTYQNSETFGAWTREDPRKDPRLRGDVLSMPMRIIQVTFSQKAASRPITQKKQFRVDMHPTNQKVLETFGSNDAMTRDASLCLGTLLCGIDGRLVARYFLCVSGDDELYAHPTPFYRLVTPQEAFNWPYMECHVLLDRGISKPAPFLRHLRDPVEWNLSQFQHKTTLNNGWTWLILGSDCDGDGQEVGGDLAVRVSDKAKLSYQLRFAEGNEIWNLTLTLKGDNSDAYGRAKAVRVKIKLQCASDPNLEAQVVRANHKRREGPVTELWRRMSVLGGSAELVVSVFYGVELTTHYYSPMIRFRGFEASGNK